MQFGLTVAFNIGGKNTAQRLITVPGDGDEGFTLLVEDLIQYGESNIFTQPTGMYFKPDGTSAYVIDISTKEMYQYNLSTPWDLSTLSLAYTVSSASTNNIYAKGLFIRPDGLVAWTINGSVTSTVSIIEYTMSTAWEFSTLNISAIRTLPNVGGSSPASCFFSPDGLNFYHHYWNGNTYIQRFTLSSAWDLTTAAPDSNFNIGYAQNGEMAFSSDGAFAFCRPSNSGIYQYELGTPWDITTINSTPVSTASSPNNFDGLYLSENDDRVMACDSAFSRMQEFRFE